MRMRLRRAHFYCASRAYGRFERRMSAQPTPVKVKVVYVAVASIASRYQPRFVAAALRCVRATFGLRAVIVTAADWHRAGDSTSDSFARYEQRWPMLLERIDVLVVVALKRSGNRWIGEGVAAEVAGARARGIPIVVYDGSRLTAKFTVCPVVKPTRRVAAAINMPGDTPRFQSAAPPSNPPWSELPRHQVGRTKEKAAPIRVAAS